ncbi:MAG: ribosome biogenesis GTPase Der [Gemmatales bacterium]|nr:ribosome biogenesis GTPase Der [Gemmatales bacterium]MDW7994649.1 ribosome biogenesis GTPase Der [Gemmatales bacterium]
MALPKVAIVGRPNVGKSSLFNWLAGRNIAIVEPTAGTTRDRLTTVIEADGRYFEICDTAGWGIEDRDRLTEHIEKQIEYALQQADVLLFVVDVHEGLMPLDQQFADRLRRIDKPILLVANKCDTRPLEHQAGEFLRLGFGEPLCVSTQHNRGKEALLERLLQLLPPSSEAPPSEALKLAIVGRRNVGKSTLINTLAQEERVIVSEVAGTTRDSVDVRFEFDGKVFLAIDTAGLRKRRSIQQSVEFYSVKRAERAIRRADVVLHLFDATDAVSRVDKQLAHLVVEEHKPTIFVVNKWDLVQRFMPTDRWVEHLQQTFPALDYVPIAFISAKTGKNVRGLLDLAETLHKQAGVRVATSELNRVLQWALERQSPPIRQNRTPRIYYATQVAVHPPTIVLMVNEKALFDPPYLRYLLKVFREQLPFKEVPIHLILRDKEEQRRRKSAAPAASVETLPSVSPSPKKRSHTQADQESTSDVWRDV